MNRAQRREAQYKRAVRTLPYHLTAEAHAPLRALQLSRPFAEGETTTEHLKTRAAFERLCTGGADEGDFDRVAMAMNLGKVRAADIDEQLVALFDRAQDAMVRVKTRYLRCNHFAFDGQGLQVMTEAMDVHEQVTDASSPLQMREALLAVQTALTQQVQAYTAQPPRNAA